MGAERKVRVLIAKVGLDGHEVGARVIARGELLLRTAPFTMSFSWGFRVRLRGIVPSPSRSVVDANQVPRAGLAVIG